MNVAPVFLSKTYSLIYANYVIVNSKEAKDGKLFGMSSRRIAAEIYTHAVLYYAASPYDIGLTAIGWDTNPFASIRYYTNGDGLNVNNDDKHGWGYYTIWYLTPGIR